MECGGSRVCTRTLSLKVEVPGHLAWVCLASPAEQPAANFPSHPKPARLWTVTYWIMFPRNKEVGLPGGGDLEVLGWCPAQSQWQAALSPLGHEAIQTKSK